MEIDSIEILKAIVHNLDNEMSEPSLSNHLLVLDEDIIDYLSSCAAKALSSDELKKCVFNEDSYIKNTIKEFDDNFVDKTRETAMRIFGIMQQSGAIPSGDIIMMIMVIDGEDFLGIMKINYKTSFVHQFKTIDQTQATMICKQGGILPSRASKPAEAAFINLSTLEVTAIEKRYDLGTAKDFYLTPYVLGCRSELSDKSKLEIVKSTAETVYKESYGDTLDKAPMVATVICDEIEDDDTLNLGTVCKRFCDTFPEATSDIHQRLSQKNIDVTQEIAVPESVLKKLAMQYVHTYTGLTVSVPTSEYYNMESMEYVTNEDGTIDLIVKNIIKEKKSQK